MARPKSPKSGIDVKQPVSTPNVPSFAAATTPVVYIYMDKLRQTLSCGRRPALTPHPVQSI